MTGPVQLSEMGYELLNETEGVGADFRFGQGTDIRVSVVDFGETGTEDSGAPQPRADGVRFGRDYYRGRTISFDGMIHTMRSHPHSTIAAPDALEGFQSAWSPETLRMTPGAVTALRMHRAGRIRRVYGRPARLAATMGRTKHGRIPFSATFKCVDHLFYDDTEFSEVIPFIPDSLGGLIGQLEGPIIASPPGVGSGNILVKGTKPSWLVYKIQGPIINPTIEVTDRWFAKLNLTLNYDQFVLVDPTPWNRTVRRNDGANLSGVFTANSARLSQMRIYPGVNQVLLRGTDSTATASIQTYWRDTYASF